MQDRQLYEQILGIARPWSVERVELRLEAGEVHVHLRHAEEAKWPCPECGRACPLHDHEPERTWRHLDTCQYQTLVHAAVPRAACPEHGVKTVRVPWAEPHSRFTLLLERLAIEWMQEAGRAAVARRLDLSWAQADRIMQRAVERGLARRAGQVSRRIGVDEKSFQKGHEYVTVLCDLDEGHVLHVADDRRKESLEAFYRGLSAEQRAGIEAVAMDMWEPYVQATAEHVPGGAEKIVFDRFHIAKNLSDAVDRIRRREHRQLMREGNAVLKGTRYRWLRNSDRFSEQAWRDFRPLRHSRLRTARGWALKETLAVFWEYRYAGAARNFFHRWYAWAIRSRLEPIKRVARTLKARLPNLLSYFRHRITNAATESLNAKIQWIKYTSRGFRSRDGFRRAIYFHCGGLDLHPRPLPTK
jgi:transposase